MYKGIIKKSRTMDLAALTAMVGTLLATLPELRVLISAEHYAYGLVGLSVLQAYLRAKTTGPMGEK